MAKHRKLQRLSKKSTKSDKTKERIGLVDMECRIKGCVNALYVPADVVSVMCSTCFTALCPPPALCKETNPAKQQLQKVQQDLRSKGDWEVELPAFPKGWHRRKHFKIKIGDKTYYFSKGQPLTRNEFNSSKRKAKAVQAKATPHSGFGRGWHLKKEFVAPDGTVFSYGKEVKS